MFRNRTLHSTEIVSFGSTSVEECIVNEQVVAYKTTDLPAIYEASLVSYVVRQSMKIRHVNIMSHRYSDSP